MPGWRDSDEGPAGQGYRLGASALRVVGHASLLAAIAMGLTALLGSAASIGGAVLAFGVSVAAEAGAGALQNKADQAAEQERREREDEIQRENAAVDAGLLAMEAEQVRSDNLERLLGRRQCRSTGKGV
jgi:hypothetical protein